MVYNDITDFLSKLTKKKGILKKLLIIILLSDKISIYEYIYNIYIIYIIKIYINKINYLIK